MDRGRLTDGGLVDNDYLVDLGIEDDPVVLPGLVPGPVDDLHHTFVEGLVHKRRLPASRDTGDNGKEADGELCIDILEVVLPAALDREELLCLPPLLRDIDLLCTDEILAREGFFVLLDLLRVSLSNDMAAVHPGPGSHVDDVLCGPDHVLVVLYHENRVPEIPEGPEGFDQLPVVPLVEPDRGFVEDIEDAHQVRADLGGEPDPLGFPSRKGPGVPGEREISQADFFQKVEPGLDLLDDLDRDLLLLLGQLQVHGRGQHSSRPADRSRR